MKNPLTRPSATLSPQGRGTERLGLPPRRRTAKKSSPSPLRGEGGGEGAFGEFLLPLADAAARTSPCLPDRLDDNTQPNADSIAGQIAPDEIVAQDQAAQ